MNKKNKIVPVVKPYVRRVDEIDSSEIAFNFSTMKKICLITQDELLDPDTNWGEFNLPTPRIVEEGMHPHMFFDRGGDVLAVAHMDSYGEDMYHFELVDFSGDERVYCANLDDRIGAYVILDLLNNSYGLNYDILLTWGEETGNSSARNFETAKQYNWIFEFDRTGTDAVMYEFENNEMKELVNAYGWKVGIGSFTDICYLEGLECKGFNFGSGYHDYHGKYAYAKLRELAWSIKNFLTFFEDQKENFMEHEETVYTYSYRGTTGAAWDDDYYTNKPYYNGSKVWDKNAQKWLDVDKTNGTGGTDTDTSVTVNGKGQKDWNRTIIATWVEDKEEIDYFDLPCSDCGTWECYGELECPECNKIRHDSPYLYAKGICAMCKSYTTTRDPGWKVGCGQEGCEDDDCIGILVCNTCMQNFHNDPTIMDLGVCTECWNTYVDQCELEDLDGR